MTALEIRLRSLGWERGRLLTADNTVGSPGSKGRERVEGEWKEPGTPSFKP